MVRKFIDRAAFQSVGKNPGLTPIRPHGEPTPSWLSRLWQMRCHEQNLIKRSLTGASIDSYLIHNVATQVVDVVSCHLSCSLLEPDNSNMKR